MAKSKQVQNVTIYNIYDVDSTCNVQIFSIRLQSSTYVIDSL